MPEVNTHELQYWAAVLDVKCSWSIVEKAGRLPVPVISLATKHQLLAKKFAKMFELPISEHAGVYQVQAMGPKLEAMLRLVQHRLKFRDRQLTHWLGLIQHIGQHRGRRYLPLSDHELAQRHRLIARARAEPFKVG